MKIPDPLMVGDIAKICRVSPRTVGKWIDSGNLKGWRVPGTESKAGDRRVSKVDFEAFLKKYGMEHLLTYPQESKHETDHRP